jgi:hypothetical protein
MQLDVGDGLQARQGLVAVVLAPEVWRGGEQDLQGFLELSCLSMIFSENGGTLCANAALRVRIML